MIAKNIFAKKKKKRPFLSCSIMMKTHRNDVTTMLLHIFFFYVRVQSYFLLSAIVSLHESFKDANLLIQRTVIMAPMDS